MGKFKYKALTKDGRKVNGNIEATTKESAIETLHKQGFTPLVVKSADKKGEIAFLSSKKVKSKEIVVYVFKKIIRKFFSNSFHLLFSK